MLVGQDRHLKAQRLQVMAGVADQLPRLLDPLGELAHDLSDDDARHPDLITLASGGDQRLGQRPLGEYVVVEGGRVEDDDHPPDLSQAARAGPQPRRLVRLSESTFRGLPRDVGGLRARQSGARSPRSR